MCVCACWRFHDFDMWCVCDINTRLKKKERKKSKNESLWSDDHLSAMNTPGAQSLAGKFHLLQKGKTVLLEGVASGWCISRTASQHGSSYTAQWPCVPRMRKPGRVQWQSRLRFVSVSSVWSGREVTVLRWRKSSAERMTAPTEVSMADGSSVRTWSSDWSCEGVKSV